jgi:hypothetical protein
MIVEPDPSQMKTLQHEARNQMYSKPKEVKKGRTLKLKRTQ